MAKDIESRNISNSKFQLEDETEFDPSIQERPSTEVAQLPSGPTNTVPTVQRWVEQLQRVPSSASQQNVFRSIQNNFGNKFARTVARSYHDAQTSQPPSVQRITFKSANVVIDTLSVAECNDHVKRLFRLKNGKGIDGDSDYTYNYDQDLKDLKLRIEVAKGDELETRRKKVVADLESALSSLATAPTFVTPPPWVALNPGPGNSPEVFAPGSTKPEQVIQAWKDFLGPGPYSHKQPRTGADDPTRLTSADGLRTIRYGDHEKTSDANKHHFHKETWTHNAGNNTVDVNNLACRTPIT